MRWPLIALGLIALAGCGREYVCPDPIGPIVRQDCDAYATRYDALEVELGVTFAGVGVHAGVADRAVRDPSDLLQVMRLQTEAICRDYNACRVAPTDYRRRRTAHDRRFTAAVALLTGVRQAEDAATRRALVDRLLATLTAEGAARPDPAAVQRKHDPFRTATTVWLGAHHAAPMPTLPPGVPALATWAVRPRRGRGEGGHAVFLRFRGPAQADDFATVTLPSGATARCPVKPLPTGPERGTGGAARCVLADTAVWPHAGEMTVHFTPGLTGETTRLGAVPLSTEIRLQAAWLAVLPTPVQLLPVEHERLWLVLRRPERSTRNVTLRCRLGGRPVGGVRRGHTNLTRDADGLRRYHFPLPVALPRQSGGLRATADDLLAGEAAGRWACTVSVTGKPVRTIEFTLGPDGHPASPRPPSDGVSPPWWPI